MPNTLFVFINDLNQEMTAIEANDFSRKSVSLEILSQQHLNAPFDEVIGVIAAPIVSEHNISLPTLKFADKTIPNLLEDKLTAPIDSLHFAYLNRLENNKTRVLVIEKEAIETIIKTFEDALLPLTQLVSLNLSQQNKNYLSPVGTIVNQEQCLGLIPNALIGSVFDATQSGQILSFLDSPEKNQEAILSHTNIEITKIEEPFYEYFVKHFNKEDSINLLQNAYQPKLKHKSSEKMMRLTSYLMLASLSLFLLAFGTQYVILTKQNKNLTQKIDAIYYRLFPGASQIISPRIRVERLLQGVGNSNIDSDGFLNLLSKSGMIIDNANVDLVKIVRYQNKSMSFSLTISSFAKLTNLTQKLEANGLKVKQTQTNTNGNQVETVLEISAQ